MAKRKIKYKNIGGLLIVLLLMIVLTKELLFSKKTNNQQEDKPKIEEISDFSGMSFLQVQEYCEKKNIDLDVKYIYSEEILKDIVIDSNIVDNSAAITVSKGNIPYNLYQEKNINELGKVAIMMYHGIVNTTTNKYVGGNVDKDGYNRTSNAFRGDLEFYYENGYRMIRLIDYVNGLIDVPLGYSPIILTFDDGNKNNFNVLGKDENGNLIIDPECAVGILESFKEKYSDYNVTATFFVTSDLFNQKEYNQEILTWLVEHGYDIGNHTTGHNNLSNITIEKTQEVIGKMYQTLDNYIPNKYVKIVALPFGSPYKKTHANYKYVLSGSYKDYVYETVSALRVGWESEVSPFHKNFDKTFLKRCRAYDNNGKEFDIEMVFKSLKTSRYISDGDIDTIVIKESNSTNLSSNLDSEKIVIKY